MVAAPPNNKTTANGKPVEIATAWRATKPPPKTSAAATAPPRPHQKIRWGTGVFKFPFDAKLSMTIEPLSDEVTKKTIDKKIETIVVSSVSGNCSSITNNCKGTSASPICGWLAFKAIAEPPNTVIQTMQPSVGASKTQVMNSRTVLPIEILAMNIPTNGDHEIHQDK